MGYLVVFCAGVMAGIAMLALFSEIGKAAPVVTDMADHADAEGDTPELVTLEGGSMLKRTFRRLACWYRKNSNYRRSRKQSDYRAIARTQRAGYFRSLPEGALTGDPLAR
jgi:hypothetical protein